MGHKSEGHRELLRMVRSGSGGDRGGWERQGGPNNQEVWVALGACWITRRASGGGWYLGGLGWSNWANSEAHLIPTWPEPL